MARPSSTFRTELTPATAKQLLQTHEQVLTLGSCFGTHVAKWLEVAHVPVLHNPAGVLFNPVSMQRLVAAALAGTLPERFVEKADGSWVHLDFHSDFWADSKAALAEKLHKQLEELQQWLKKTNFVVLTLGTAWIYEHQQQVVANCHKLPAARFEKRLLALEEAKEAVSAIAAALPQTRLLLTISPVRHIKNTLQLDAVSKATLRLAVHQLCEQLPQVSYFPAYEVVLDDLRDYRFFEADMLHPNQQAVAYVLEKFAETHTSEAVQHQHRQWLKVRQQLSHRPLRSASAENVQRLKKLEQQLAMLDAERKAVEWGELQNLLTSSKN